MYLFTLQLWSFVLSLVWLALEWFLDSQVSSDHGSHLVLKMYWLSGPALKPILVLEGVYGEHCPEDPDTADNHEDHIPCVEQVSWGSITSVDKRTYNCYLQDLKLNLMFTMATVTTNVVALPVGYLMDTIGPRRTSMIGGLLFGLGCLSFGSGIITPGLFQSLIIHELGLIWSFGLSLRFLHCRICYDGYRWTSDFLIAIPPFQRIPS